MSISTGLDRYYLRIGIVLPEDAIDSVTLTWKENEHPVQPFGADVKGVTLTVINENIFSIKDSNGKEMGTAAALEVAAPDDLDVLTPGFGMAVSPVVAGRGFHWEKHIDVTLPGKVQITVREGHLLVVNQVSVESYVVCVATSEMGAKAPADLLAAQTVVARCYVLASVEKKFEHLGIDFCNDDSSQRYQGTTYLTDFAIEAARRTENEVVVYENKVIDARYSKNCGGVMEEFDFIWGGKPEPYFVPKWDGPEQLPGFADDDLENMFAYEDAYCSHNRFENVDLLGMLGKVDVAGSYHRWEMKIEKAEILRTLKKFRDVEWTKLLDVEPLERGKSGRLARLRLTGINGSGVEEEQIIKTDYNIRQIMSESFLFSSGFVVLNSDTVRDDDFVHVKGLGWGHGAGMCQMGALGMALAGISYKDILEHYYPGTELKVIKE